MDPTEIVRFILVLSGVGLVAFVMLTIMTGSLYTQKDYDNTFDELLDAGKPKIDYLSFRGNPKEFCWVVGAMLAFGLTFVSMKFYIPPTDYHWLAYVGLGTPICSVIVKMICQQVHSPHNSVNEFDYWEHKISMENKGKSSKE